MISFILGVIIGYLFRDLIKEVGISILNTIKNYNRDKR